jgi:polar amino acid transport system substrate-binding protein
MKKSVLSAIGFCIVFLCFTSVSLAGPVIDQIMKKKELVVGTSATYPPLTFKAKNGKPYGLDIDIAQSIASEMGVKLRVEIIPFDKLIPALESGNIHMIISCMTITPKRNLRVALVGPYFTSGQSLLTTKDVAININSQEDINKPDFAVAVPRGTTTEQLARQLLSKANIVVVESTDQAMSLLLEKKVNALMADYPYVTVEALRYKDKGLVSNLPLNIEPLGFAIRNDDPLLLNFLENFLIMIRNNGFLHATTQRWFADPSWMVDLP